jgi:hypothetical protein
LIPFSNRARAAEVFLESFKRRGGFSGGGVGTPKEVGLRFADVILPLSTEVEGFPALTGLVFLSLPATLCFDFLPPAFPELDGLFRGIDFDLAAGLEAAFRLGLVTLPGFAPTLFFPAETPAMTSLNVFKSIA